MYFYCYNVQTFLPDTLYLYGRKIETENEKDLEEIKNLKTKQIKITVDSVKSPLLAVYNSKENIKELEEDIRKYFGSITFIEQDKLKNVFFEDLSKEVEVLRFVPEKLFSKKNALDFTSPFCTKIMYEYANPLEAVLVSKGIKTPCILKTANNKTFIKLQEIQKVIKSNMPSLNYASFDCKIENSSIASFSLCINGSKFYAGTLRSHCKLVDESNSYKCHLDIFENTYSLISKINQILAVEEIDCIIFFNTLGIPKKDLHKFILCDLYQYASAHIKGREHSIKELCEYFSIDYHNNSLDLSKILFDIFSKSNVLILAKELSELSGFTINKVLSNNIAEIIEYLLFHELYNNKYLLPPEKTINTETYSGGLVLDPIIGSYNELVLLFDFNSLYPSIIQEYNVCFSNLNNDLTEKGILPKILSNLIKRRREVKKLMKDDTSNMIYNIRQLALKILANSIYGSLGYSKSRFCNYKLAAFITEKGREILQDTKKSIEEELNLQVVYGDTDSIMINTKLEYTTENIAKSKLISQKVLDLINSKYKNVELDLEKIFIRLLIYKKKKYIGRYLDMKNVLKEEYKGIDSVKRSFCPASADITNKVNKILLGINNTDLWNLLQEEYDNLIHKEKKDFVITNMLNKPLSQYSVTAPIPFVHLCNRLKDKGYSFKVNDMISYIIGVDDKKKEYYKRAFLPSENVKIDYLYYINNQILPPLLRSLSISQYFNTERIYKIFNVEYKKSFSNKTWQIKTECCQVLQNPALNCIKCNKTISEDFYIKNFRDMIGFEIDRIYLSCFECTECKCKYSGYFNKCLYCMTDLQFNPKNDEFDFILDKFYQVFTSMGYLKVSEYIKMHLDNSEFRVYDISIYFKDKINT